MKPRVYVTNYNGSYDYSGAEQFGEIINMTQGFIPLHRYDSILNVFSNYAKTANENDYLLLSGSNLVCGLAVSAWMKHHKSVKLLQHGKARDENKSFVPTYLEYHVNFSE